MSKTLQIQCNSVEQDCVLDDTDARIIITDLVDHYVLAIDQLDVAECSLSLQFVDLDEATEKSDHVLGQLAVEIKREENSIVNTSLNSLFANTVVLGELTPQSTTNYQLIFDASSLRPELLNTTLTFDLLLDFSCQQHSDQLSSDTISLSAGSAPHTTAVLGANTQDIVDSDGTKYFYSFIALLTLLFALLFFVIMKYIHGKKK